MNASGFAAAFDEFVDARLEWLSDNGGWFFDGLNDVLHAGYQAIYSGLTLVPYYVIILLFGVLGWRLTRSWRFAVGAMVGLLLCSIMGLWPQTMSTLALVLAATSMALIVGIPLGVAAGLMPSLDRVSEPVLDLSLIHI